MRNSFLRENMVHPTGQLSMPVIEVALVVSKFIRIVSNSLREAADSTGEEIPMSILSPIPIKSPDIEEKEDLGINSFPLENLIGMVDQDRMDILDTLIRNVVNESELEFIHTLQELRQWDFISELSFQRFHDQVGCLALLIFQRISNHNQIVRKRLFR